MPETKEVDRLAKIIWGYHHMNQPLKKADAILVLGSHDIRVAERAADLYSQGWAPIVIFSGNKGALTEKVFDKTEAEIFADRAIKLGVPKDKILLEKESTNTGENILFTKRLLDSKGININSFIVVQKPYMERRSFATFKKQWPDKDFIVTSPQIQYADYFNDQYPKDYIINVMVGDLQRIKEYPKLSFQIPQDIPDNVWQAYEKLVSMGFTEHLIKQ